MNSEDFYSPKMVGGHPQGPPYGVHPGSMMGGVVPNPYPGVPSYDPQNNNSSQNQNLNNSNSDANSSSSTTSSNGNIVNVNNTTKERKVNFKIDIKAEPNDGAAPGSDPLALNPMGGGGMQKVPSISDLSDHDSSLDLPCNQVRKSFFFKWLWINTFL